MWGILLSKLAQGVGRLCPIWFLWSIGWWMISWLRKGMMERLWWWFVQPGNYACRDKSKQWDAWKDFLILCLDISMGERKLITKKLGWEKGQIFCSVLQGEFSTICRTPKHLNLTNSRHWYLRRLIAHSTWVFRRQLTISWMSSRKKYRCRTCIRSWFRRISTPRWAIC